MSQAGLLVQVDGSRHDWLEGRGPWLTLVGGIDDATGVVTGRIFREQEDAAGYLDVLTQTALAHGLPVGLYSDRHGIFWKGRQTVPTLAEQFAGRRSTTQFGRALEAAGIAWIAARSPQAKGRVERLWGTLQDRLTSELRLAGVGLARGRAHPLRGTTPGAAILRSDPGDEIAGRLCGQSRWPSTRAFPRCGPCRARGVGKPTPMPRCRPAPTADG